MKSSVYFSPEMNHLYKTENGRQVIGNNQTFFASGPFDELKHFIGRHYASLHDQIRFATGRIREFSENQAVLHQAAIQSIENQIGWLKEKVIKQENMLEAFSEFFRKDMPQITKDVDEKIQGQQQFIRNQYNQINEQMEEIHEQTAGQMNRMLEQYEQSMERVSEMHKEFRQMKKHLSEVQQQCEDIKKEAEKGRNHFQEAMKNLTNQLNDNLTSLSKRLESIENSFKDSLSYFRFGDRIMVTDRNGQSTGVFIRTTEDAVIWVSDVTNTLTVSNFKGLTISKLN